MEDQHKVQLFVDGIEKDVPGGAEISFSELMSRLRAQYSGETSLISSVRIAGVELSESDERVFAAMPVRDLGPVEIFTAHPHEVARETLQNLLVFSRHLELLSRSVAENMDQPAFARDFAKLVEGIGTFTDAIHQVRSVLRIGLLQPVAVLEADLVSVLKDLLHYQEKGEKAYVTELLREHLPANLAEWREQGIPLMIRSRDS